MKKVIAIPFSVILLAACNNSESNIAASTDTVTSTNTVATTDTTTLSVSAPRVENTTYAPADGDVTYREKTVKVMKNGQWVDADNDVKMDDGTVVYRNGKVKKNDKEAELNDGDIVNKTGNFFNKSGEAIENAWDDTKEGAKKAGKFIGQTADKVGEKIKNAVDNDKKQ